MPELEDLQDEWKVEEIRDSKRIDGKRYYLIKWMGWPSEYDSWEPEEHLENASEAVARFKRRYRDAEADPDEDVAPRRRKRR
jgi:hypothetical protein